MVSSGLCGSDELRQFSLCGAAVECLACGFKPLGNAAAHVGCIQCGGGVEEHDFAGGAWVASEYALQYGA